MPSPLDAMHSLSRHLIPICITESVWQLAGLAISQLPLINSPTRYYYGLIAPKSPANFIWPCVLRPKA